VTDEGSKAGTFVNGARLAAQVPMVLGDTATLEFGSTRFTFYSEDSPHQTMVRSLVVDAETGALQAGRLEAEIQRGIRRGSRRLLAVFDIDRFTDVQEELGEVRAHELVRTFAEELRQGLWDEALRTGGLFRHGPDSLVYLFRSEDPNEPFEETAARLERVRARVALRLGLERPHLTSSAAVVPVQSTDPKEAVRRLEHKLLQAKLAGGGWTAASRTEVTWMRSDLGGLMSLVHVASEGSVGVAIGSPAAVRRQVARTLELLPEAKVHVAWNTAANAVVVLTSVGVEALKPLTQSMPGCTWIPLTVDDAKQRLHAIVENAEEAKKSHPECFVIANALAEYKGLYANDGRRPQLARATYESCLQALGAIAVAAAARLVLEHPTSRESETALTVLDACRPERLGAGGWGWLLERAMGFLGPWLPSDVRRHLSRPRRDLGARRNAAAHAVQALRDNEETATSLIEWCEVLNRGLATPQWALVDVSRVTFHRCGNHQTVECRVLQGREKPRPKIERMPTTMRLAEGLWLRCDARWLYLRPFAEYRACLGCERDHLFLASGPPSRFVDREVRLDAFGLDSERHPPIAIPVVEDDMLEAFALFERLSGPRVTQPGVRSPQMDFEEEPTGLHALPRFESDG
jgi:GGDEF domain-containing protein